jgi:hypothetical protein
MMGGCRVMGTGMSPRAGLDAGPDLQQGLTLPAASEDMEANLFATGQRRHPDNTPERAWPSPSSPSEPWPPSPWRASGS